jgi:predicted TIM-barrel fold metal-dependent hydrolase
VNPQELVTRRLAPFEHEVAMLRPGGPALDAHTHLGLDEDGMTLDLATLLEQMDAADVEHAFTFPLHDPERHPAYRLPNDRVLAWAGESGGRLIPFCRLDPGDDPINEAERCLAAGARGIKLHPRAQAFDMVHSGVVDIFALAEQAQVPILIHAGRGLPATFGPELVEIAQRHPGASLILAHLGVVDQGALVNGLRDHPGVVYDTSWFNPIDAYALLSRVSAERLVFGSDPPYGRPFNGLLHVLRLSATLALPAETVRGIIGGTATAMVEGRPLPPAGPPPAPAVVRMDARLARLHSAIVMAFGCAFVAPDQAKWIVEGALAICRDPDPGPAQAALERIAPLLEGALVLFEAGERRPGLSLLVPALIVSATEVPQRRPVEVPQG